MVSEPQPVTEQEKESKMVAFSSMSESKFMKKEDLNQERGNLVTIVSFARQKVEENDDGTTEYKFTVKFREFDKPLVLNATNRAILERVYGSDTEDCINKQIVIYVDENVSYAGKLVGGIRMRAVRKAPTLPAATPAPVPDPVPQMLHVDPLDEDIPFN